jgi:microcystin-dependent protein
MAEPFVGEIRLFSFGVIPRGWLPCQGQLLSIQQNQALFAVLGVQYGGNGSTTFALPDLRGRVPLNTSPDYPMGATAGEPAHTVTVNEMPRHTHSVSASGEPATLVPPAGNVWPQSANTYSAVVPNVQMGADAVSVAGGSQAHNNMQPYLTINFCIATVGIFPPRS